jgi:A118 family predicted phage portal protein
MYNELREILSRRSINIPTYDNYEMIEMWKSWYRGNVDDFHYYNVQMADGSVTQCERLTMNMGKKVAEDFAKLVWSEKVQIKLDTDEKTAKLWSVLDSKENNFSTVFPQFIEKTFALGGGVLVEYLVDGEPRIDYITADNAIPFAQENEKITGFISLSQFKDGINKKTAYYTLLTFHEYKDGKYIKYNELYKSKSESELGKPIDFNSMFPEVPEYIEYETDTPHFQFIKPNIANNHDLTSSLGISVFANALDRLKAIDVKYDSFTNEFELGKKRILVDRTAIKSSAQVDVDGNVRNVSYFDRKDKVYVAINGMENQPVKEIDFTLRVEDHISAINSELKWLSAAVGLGQDYYSFDKDGLKTATEVISDKSDTYRTKVSHQIVIKDAIYDLIKSIMYLIGIDGEITIVFDDSIIEDTGARIERGLKLLAAGVISKETFLVRYLEYTEEEAQEELARVKEDNKIIMPEGVDFFGE